MRLAMVGLGRMGANMAERLRRHGHEIVSFDVAGGGTAGSLAELVGQLGPGAGAGPGGARVAWLMVPAGQPTEDAFQELLGLLGPGDVLVDGGNSNFRDSQRRARQAAERGIGFVDAGTSGGVWGLENGYCLMVGGSDEAVAAVEPAFRSLAPASGYIHAGPSGAGHFAKMVHNGIEYGLMQAYAEGFEILATSEFGFDLAALSSAWREGSVVRSWLLDLAHLAFTEEGNDLAAIKGFVEDSGEGRWTIAEAIAQDVPAPVITAALFARFASRQDESFAAKVNAALRAQFGGHSTRPAE